jgi:hypothetical protein
MRVKETQMKPAWEVALEWTEDGTRSSTELIRDVRTQLLDDLMEMGEYDYNEECVPMETIEALWKEAGTK